MNIYVKLGLISFLAGTLSARIVAAYASYATYGLDYVIQELPYVFRFWNILPFILLGGLPSMVILTLLVKVWKKSGTTEKSMNLYCIIFGFMIGVLTRPCVVLTGGF